jgi:hypothetical protein
LRSRRVTTTRNRLDLNDRVQVRIVRRRLKVSDQQLASLVQKAGSSIAALRKEAGFQRVLTLPSAHVPSAEVIAKVKDPAATEEQAAS